VRLGENLLAEPQWKRAQRDEVNNLLDTMDSLAHSLIFPIALIVGAGMVVFGYELPRDKNLEQLSKSDTFNELTTLYFVSLLGSNPLATLVTIPLILICTPIMLLGYRGSFAESVEKPVLQASTVVMAAYENRRRVAA
jgi:hypothetical protein